jgi:hypothetical protein
MKTLAAMVAALGLSATPVLAAEPAPASEPVKLADSELDQVTAGEGLLDVFAPINVTLQDITVSLEVSNVPVNLAAAVQVNAIGQAIQTATVTSFQQVTQVSQ